MRIFLFALLLFGVAGAEPRIHCESPAFQFGSMDSSSTVKTSFMIRNTGDETLAFTKVRNCCGVLSQLSKMTILPGSNAVLSVQFVLKGRKGPQLKTIYLISNDLKEPFYKIRLMGRVVPVQEADSFAEAKDEAEAAKENVSQAEADPDTTVLIDFFYELGCHDCEQIEAELFPEIEKRFAEACVIRPHDIGIETNFIYLLKLENAIGHLGPDRGYLIVNKQFLFGPNPSPEEFISLISDLVEQGKDGSVGDVAPPVSSESDGRASLSERADTHLVEERFSGFTVGAVLVAGLLDGLNPCAISTLVFFMSLLAVSKIRNRQLVLLGISFCLASFLTYLALGFGLLRVLHLFTGFKTVRAVIEWGMVAVLAVLSVLSFRDALRFRKSGRADDVTLQLPMGMKKRIHDVMRRGLGTGHLVLGGLFIGAAVTALESVCTGQVYVPTLVLILKDNASQVRAWVLLLLYNALFIFPLVVVFIAVYCGLRTETLLTWSRKNVVLGKFLLGGFFVLMAVLILFL